MYLVTLLVAVVNIFVLKENRFYGKMLKIVVQQKSSFWKNVRGGD
jgi:hypothetical protein